MTTILRRLWVIGTLMLAGMAGCAAEYGAALPMGSTVTDLGSTELQDGDSQGAQALATKRMIVYRADVTAETENVDKFSSELLAKLSEWDGFIASSTDQRLAGDQRLVKWTLRLPNEHFAASMQWLNANVKIEHKDIASQDMTEEYVDVKARIANKKGAEQRLIQILGEQATKLDEVLTVERELSRVREEIERMEGRLRLLNDQITFCTVTLAVRTKVIYLQPAIPTFAMQISETWNSSLADLLGFLQGLTLISVAVIPWIPLLVCGIGIPYLCIRYLRRLSPPTSAKP